jgi:DNA-binding transcriptional MerR regulator
MATPQTTLEADPLLSQQRVAELLGVEIETLARWRRTGVGPQFYRIANRVRYRVSDLEKWIKQQKQENRSGGTPPEECVAARASS